MSRELVEVTQADRDAAAALLSLGAGDDIAAWEQVVTIRKGQADDSPAIEAFARHRLATLPPQDSSEDAGAEARKLLAAEWDREAAANDHKGYHNAATNCRQRAEEILSGKSDLQAVRAVEAALSRQDHVGEDELVKRVWSADQWPKTRPTPSELARRSALLRQDHLSEAEQDEVDELNERVRVIQELTSRDEGYDRLVDRVKRLEAALASCSAPDGWVLNEIARLVVQDVCELPDRTSPEDEPDMLLVTANELDFIVRSAVSQALAASPSALDGEGVE